MQGEVVAVLDRTVDGSARAAGAQEYEGAGERGYV